MKKLSKKIVALTLASVMAISVGAGFAPAAKEVEATDTSIGGTDASEWDYSIDFENVSAKDITDFTSTRFDGKNDYAIVGDIDWDVYDHWFTGTELVDEYGRDTGYKDQNVSTSSGNRSAGIKPLTGKDSQKQHYLMNYNGEQYENFEVSAEIHSNLATDGIAFGEKNVLGLSATSSSAMVYFTGSNTGGRLVLTGAFDYSTAKVTGNSADTSNLSFNTSTHWFTFHYTGSAISRGQVFDLHVKKEGKTVTIWVDGYDPVLTVKLASTWKEGPVSLYSAGCYHGGGFKSFAIKEIQNYVNFEEVSVKELTDFTSTKIDSSNGYSVVENNKTAYDHWYTGTETTDEYGRTTGYADHGTSTAAGNRSKGLKALTSTKKSYRYLLNYEGAQYDNYEITAEIHTSLATDGIAFGERDVFPTTADSTSARVYFSSNSNHTIRVNLEGAFDYTSWKKFGSSTDASYDANYHRFTFAPNGSRGQLEELHIRKEGNTITIWIDGYDAGLTIELASTWKKGPVSLCTHGTDSGGGFKSFALQELPYYINFEETSVKDIQDFTSTKIDSSNNYSVVENNKTAYEHWYNGTENTDEYGRTTGYADHGTTTATGNRSKGLKALTSSNKSYRYLLNYEGAQYDNYEITAEIHTSLATDGIAFGERDVFPTTADSTSARVYFSSNSNHTIRVNLEGAFDYTSWKKFGSSTDASYDANYHRFTFAPNGSRGQLEELHIRKEGNTITIWIDGYDAGLTIELASTWKKGPVALCSHGTNAGGGFKSFTVEEIKNVKEPGFFVNADLSKMADFTSTQFDSSDGYSIVGEAEQSVNTHWFTGRDTTLYNASNVTAAYRNCGLKPNHDSTVNRLSMFTYNKKVSDNYEMSFSFYKNFVNYGAVIGQRNTYPQDVQDPAIRFNIHTQGGQYYLAITGAIDSHTAVSSGAREAVVEKEMNRVLLRLDDYTVTHNASDLANSDLANKVITTIKVKVKDGKVTATVDNTKLAVTVNTNGAYVNDVVALYSNGCNQGGFDDFTITESTPTTQRDTSNLNYTMESMNNYATITLSTDTYHSKVEGKLNYNTEMYEYVGAVFGKQHYSANYKREFVNDTANKVLNIDLLANSDDEVVTVYFKTKDNDVATDFSEFAFNDVCDVTLSGGNKPNNVVQEVVLDKDYYEDDVINIFDLAIARKSQTNDSEALRGILVGANETVSPILGKSVLALGDSIAYGAGDGFYMSWAGRIASLGAISDNVAQSGWSLTNGETSGRGQIVTQLDYAKKDAYDFVLLEGGVNDVLISQGTTEYASKIQWGEINTDLEADSYDDSTIAGAMQELIVETQKKFETAKIVYIINSYYGALDENMEKYVQLVKQACEVHGITYVDLSDTETYTELVAISKANENLYEEYLPDGLHPNAASYELTTPYIVKHMEDLLLKDK